MKIILVSLTAGVSLLASCGIIPILLRLSHRFKWYDDTNHRKIHSGEIPRIGGVGIFVAFLLGFIAWRIYTSSPDGGFSLLRDIWPVITGALLIHLTGLYDDFKNIRALYKLILQIMAACIVVFTGHTLEVIYIPLLDTQVALGPFGSAVAILWLVGMSNALNLIDGMDGLAGGISASALIGLGVLFLSQGYILSAALTFSLLGGTLGFLLFNKPPAKLFMGDSGSLMLGFLIAALPLVESTRSNPMAFLLTVTLLLIPLIDTLAAILRRLRRHKPIHSADKEHLHHKLMDLGFSNPAILIILYGFSLVLTGVVIFWEFVPGIASGLCLLGGWLLISALFIILHFLSHKKKAEEQSS